MTKDLISRQAAISLAGDLQIHGDEYHMYNQAINNYCTEIMGLPSAQLERLTDDDFETIRIHLNAFKERLCNQRRWKEAEEYEKLINRFISFASAKPKIIHCKNCKHRESNDCPMYYEEWIEIDEGDGYFDTDNIIHDWTTDEGFCHCAELRGEKDEQSDLQTGCD